MLTGWGIGEEEKHVDALQLAYHQKGQSISKQQTRHEPNKTHSGSETKLKNLRIFGMPSLPSGTVWVAIIRTTFYANTAGQCPFAKWQFTTKSRGRSNMPWPSLWVLSSLDWFKGKHGKTLGAPGDFPCYHEMSGFPAPFPASNSGMEPSNGPWLIVIGTSIYSA